MKVIIHTDTGMQFTAGALDGDYEDWLSKIQQFMGAGSTSVFTLRSPAGDVVVGRERIVAIDLERGG